MSNAENYVKMEDISQNFIVTIITIKIIFLFLFPSS